MLPKTIDPIKLAKKGAHFEGKIALVEFPRLQDLSDQADHYALIDLKLDVDAARIYVIQGSVVASINMVCQRCTKKMVHDLDITFLLSPVNSDVAIKKLPDHYEPVVMQDEQINIINMIEDEILLELPMVPKHLSCDHIIS